jgi:tRNA pseudouridine13 synthase
LLTDQQINHHYQYAYCVPKCTATLKQYPADFVVKEQLSFEPEGEGTHAFLWIEKNSLNTQDVINQLSRFTGLQAKHIGYAGLKDKQAMTSQWFSINLEGLSEPDWSEFSFPNISIKSVSYHKKKLKVGSILSNEFSIILRDVCESDVSELNKKSIESRIEKIIQYGVPNYFGPQRFGIDNQNIKKADAWFSSKIKIKQRSQKSIILSAARSFLFNYLLSQRIEKYGWNNLVSGEVMMLDGSHSIFTVDDIEDADIKSRFEEKDIHPTLSLWGQGELLSTANLLQLEKDLSVDYPLWCKAMENKGLKQQRRAIRVFPQNLKFTWLEDNQLQLQFSLAKGCYATSIIRELINSH